MSKMLIVLMVAVLVDLTGMATEKEKTGILLVAFGTSYSDARGALEHVDRQVKQAFPGMDVRWAFTSNIVRRILSGKGTPVDSPAEALARMGNEGFTQIAVQSLQVIPGKEYEDLVKTVDAFRTIPKNAKTLVTGKPLLYRHEDLSMVCEAIEKIYPANGAGEAVVLMGHGTHHPADVYYAGLQFYLEQRSPAHFLATVEGYPGLREILPGLQEKKIERIRLVPFMSVAGDHARNDMAGDEPGSWKSQLEAAGFQVDPVIKGLAEYEEIVRIWIRHLKEAIDELEK